MEFGTREADIVEVVTAEWYNHLIDECKSIIVEASFTSRWALVEGYWILGKRITEDNALFVRAGIDPKEVTTRVAQSLNKSKRTVERSVQFYKKYPDLNLLPEGKNTSWHKICNKYLPMPKEKKEKIITCPNCEKAYRLSEMEISWRIFEGE